MIKAQDKAFLTNGQNKRGTLPGTATKNLTASLWPWKDSWAWAMEQYGMKLPATSRSLWSLHTIKNEKSFDFFLGSTWTFQESHGVAHL